MSYTRRWFQVMKLVKDLGMRYNPAGNVKRWGLYECNSCHKHFEARTENVKRKNQEVCKVCSCKVKNMKHDMTGHKLTAIINAMLQRCNNPKNKNYENYGGRGITVCHEWTTNRKEFFEWALANGYKEGLSIDRIDNDGNYEPTNCRWTTMLVQSTNKRELMGSNTSGYKGVSFRKDTNRWRAYTKINGKQSTIGSFDTAEEASTAFIAYVKENNLEHNYE